MKTKNNKIILLTTIFGLSVILSGLFMNINVVNLDDGITERINSMNQPQIGDLTSSNITLNGTNIMEIMRGTQWVNITINNISSTQIALGGYKANITIVKNLDGTAIPNPQPSWNLTLNPIGGNLSSNIFQFPYNIATGYANISVLYLNEFGNSIFSTWTNISWIVIKNNIPKIGVTLNQTTVKAGQTIKFQFAPSDIENPTINLTWNARIYRAGTNVLVATLISNEKIFEVDHLFPFGNSLYYPGDYYIRANCTDLDGSTISTIATFSIVNNLPVISSAVFLVNGVDWTSNNSLYVKRGADTITVRIIATDSEDNSTLRMSLSILDPVNNNNIGLGTVTDLPMSDTSKNLFEKNISLPATTGRINVGLTNLTVTITGQYPANNYYFTRIDKAINVLNNIPTFNAFYINNFSIGDHLNFTSEDILEIKFNITDVEDNIQYIRVVLEYTEDGTAKSFSYSTPYLGSVNTIVRIRAIDLPNDVYHISAYVIDGDGAEVKCEITYLAEIKEKTGIDSNTWLLMIVGLIVGITLGFGLTYWRSRSKEMNQTELETADSSVEEPSKTNSSKSKSDQKSTKKEDDQDKSSTSSSQTESGSKSKKKVIRKL